MTSVEVRVREGLLEGEQVTGVLGDSYYSFKGIPYAAPPIGELRFKAPQPAKPWNGVRSAKEFGPICYQRDQFKKSPPSGSEDCLYLNVYTPRIETNPDRLLPVMFWIHGGGFYWGSGNDDFYGPDLLVRQDVVLVTINYRLEVLGFLCLDTEDVPGNAGMKDQVAALRWVSKNIRNFGGDPDNVTIFGESAGGGSVGYHLISPMSKGLFRRAIVQSGSCSTWWAQSFEHKERAIALAKELGCTSTNEKLLYYFFKSLPVEKLISTNVALTYNEAHRPYTNVTWSIVSEKQFGYNPRFFYGDVEEALQSNIHEGVEVMIGYVADEAAGIIGLQGPDMLQKQIEHANKIPQFLVPNQIYRNCTLRQQLEVSRKMRQYYFRDEPVTKDNVDQLLKYLSCDYFIHKTTELMKECSKKNRTYSYKFTCNSKRNLFSKIFKLDEIFRNKSVVSHCDDLAYLFQLNYISQDIDTDSKEYQMIERVTRLWTNFAKFGHPTPYGSLGVTWPQYDVRRQLILDIGEELSIVEAPERREVEFWENIFREYLPK